MSKGMNRIMLTTELAKIDRAISELEGRIHTQNRIVADHPAVKHIEGGYKALDAQGQSLAYVYGAAGDASIGKTFTLNEARRIASNIAKLPTLVARSS